jgi:hypothetical protein
LGWVASSYNYIKGFVQEPQKREKFLKIDLSKSKREKKRSRLERFDRLGKLGRLG